MQFKVVLLAVGNQLAGDFVGVAEGNLLFDEPFGNIGGQ